MQAFLIGLLVKLIQDPEIRKFLMEVVDRLGVALLPKLASLIPLAAAAGVDKIGQLLQSASNIDLPGPLPSMNDLTKDIHDAVNGQIPDIDIPVVSDAFKNITGFDLTDTLNDLLGKRR